MYSIIQNRILPVATRRDLIPKTEWPELEALRLRHLEILDTPHLTESEVRGKYEAIRAEHEADLRAGRRNFKGEAPQLVAPENELANAVLEEQAWLNSLVDFCQALKQTVEIYGPTWQASLGNANGLYQMAQGAGRVSGYVQAMHASYPQILSEEAAQQVAQVIAHATAEALRVYRLYNWIKNTIERPVGMGVPWSEIAGQPAVETPFALVDGVVQ